MSTAASGESAASKHDDEKRKDESGGSIWRGESALGTVDLKGEWNKKGNSGTLVIKATPLGSEM